MPLSPIKLLSDKKLVKNIFTLAWPTITEHALQTVVQYVDTAQVGQLGAAASAAVGLTSTTTWLVNAPLWALGTGVLSAISQARGAENHKDAKAAADQAQILVLVSGILMTVLTLIISPFLPGWLGADPAIRKNASLYFGIICAPLLFRVSIIIFGAVLRSTGNTKTPMFANLVMNITNVVLNFLLINKTQTFRLGFISLKIWGAGLGVVGAGIATAVAYVIGGTWMYIAARQLPGLLSRCPHYHKRVMHKCLWISGPLAAEHTISMFGQVLFTSLIARLGTVAVAAHSIAITAEQAFYVPGFGMQTAAATLAGHSYGAKDEKKLMAYSSAIMLIAVSLMSFLSLFLFLFPSFFMRLFTPDEAVILLGSRVLRIVSLSEPFYAALIIMSGTFNGVGDVRMPLVFSFISMWCVRLPLTFICVSLLHLDLIAVWCCMIADNLTRFLLHFIRYRGNKWKRGISSLNPG